MLLFGLSSLFGGFKIMQRGLQLPIRFLQPLIHACEARVERRDRMTVTRQLRDHDRHADGHRHDQSKRRGMSFDPAPCALTIIRRTSNDRIAAEKPTQVECQFQGARIPARWLFFQALEANRLQIAGHVGSKLSRRARHILHDRLQ